MPYWFDGNNLIGQTVVQTRIDPHPRRAFLTKLSELSRARGGRFLVFFDGDDPERTAPPRGVQVRFSAPLTADDRILQALAGIRNPGEVIVVTNDSELRSRCRDAGSKTMIWGEFDSTVNRGRRVPSSQTGKEDPVKVDEWARYFGLNEDSLEK